MTFKLSHLSNLELYHYLIKNNLSKEEIELVELELANRGLDLDDTDYAKTKEITIKGESVGLESKHILYIFLAPLICLILVSFYKGLITNKKKKQFWNCFTIAFVLWCTVAMLLISLKD